MSIKKRTNKPTTTSAEFADDGDPRTTQRNPVLQGQHLDVYRFVKDNPGVTREDVSRGLSLKSSTATARTKELIDQGYLFEPGGRKVNRSGVRAKILAVTDRQEGGAPLDRVRVEVTLAIDHNGNYHASAKVIGGRPLSGTALPILRKRVTLTAPHPDTYRSAHTGKVTSLEVTANAAEIIDVDFVVLHND